VVDVLKPLEVRAGNTTTVDQEIGADNNASAGEFLLSSESCGTITSFDYDFALELGSVVLVNRFLSSSRNKDIALLLHEGKGILDFGLFGVGVPLQGAFLLEVFLNIIRVESIRVVNGGVVLYNSGDLSAVSVEELASPVADVSKSLQGEGLAFDSLREASLFAESVCV
jgi:hypothetical protein